MCNRSARVQASWYIRAHISPLRYSSLMMLSAGNGLHSSVEYLRVMPTTRTFLQERGLVRCWEPVWVLRLAPPMEMQVRVLQLAPPPVSGVVQLWQLVRLTRPGLRSRSDTTMPICSACMRRGTRSLVSTAARDELPRHLHRRTSLRGHPFRPEPGQILCRHRLSRYSCNQFLTGLTKRCKLELAIVKMNTLPISA